MGVHRQLPDRLRQLHPRYGTPWIGILVFGAAACLILIPGQADFLGLLYAFGAMLSFSIAHLSLIRLRLIKPDVKRPYRGPGNRQIRGRDVPVFAVVGLLGTGLAFVVTVLLYLDVAAVGVGWLAVGLFIFLLYRRNQGLDLTSTVKVAMPAQVTEGEAEYESILVAYDQHLRYHPGAIATAVRLAARRRRGIHVLVTITVPNSSPIDATLPEQELAAQSIIEQAKLQGGRRVSGHWEKVRAGQAGRLIVNEARDMRASALVMPLPQRRGGSIFGPTVETVLAERPCRVIIESEPDTAPRRDAQREALRT
jgi:APA family basic amino acid/polyamine antiporter